MSLETSRDLASEVIWSVHHKLYLINDPRSLNNPSSAVAFWLPGRVCWLERPRSGLMILLRSGFLLIGASFFFFYVSSIHVLHLRWADERCSARSRPPNGLGMTLCFYYGWENHLWDADRMLCNGFPHTYSDYRWGEQGSGHSFIHTNTHGLIIHTASHRILAGQRLRFLARAQISKLLLRPNLTFFTWFCESLFAPRKYVYINLYKIYIKCLAVV